MPEFPVQVGDQASDSDHEEAFASLNSVIVTGSLLALIGIGYRINTHKLKHLPESCAAIALGFVVGCAVRVFRLTEEEALLNFRGSVFFYVLLPPIIFEAGLSLKAQLFVDNLGSILAFAVVGTLISTWVVSTSLQWAAELGLVGLENEQLLPVYCQLFGALISATDPVATIALFGSSRFKADPLLHSLINGESVLNDAVAIVLFGTLVHHGTDEPRLISAPVLGQFCLVLMGSLVVGLGAGALLSWGFKRTQELARFPDYEISAMFLGAYLTFALSQLFGLSGITALFFFGIVLAQYNWYNLSEPSKVASKVAFESIAKLCEACVFVYLGVVAALSLGRFHWHFGLVFFCLLSINVARAAHVFPLSYLLNLCRRGKKISGNMSVVMWVSGLRGAIAFALSLRLPCEGEHSSRGSDECRNSDLLITTTISIVLLTTMGVGTAMEKIATALHVIEPLDHFARHSGNNQLGDLSEPLAGPRGSSVQSDDDRSLAQGSCDSIDLTRNGEDSPEVISAGRSARDFLRRSSSSLSTMSWARSLPRVRFQSRSQVYQDFARFDLSVLQPLFGGPCHTRAGGARASIGSGGDMEEVDGADPSLELPCFQGEDEPPPLQSRAVIFE
eukprot:TRINITY_DN31415_c0_g1_i1.p1 TRINITY_DN31415_c0_g1~~TRINITY_DN31415_c0_g1_i1.p1  ORF type:complete len:653 (-),score=89.53 TRINITY_DN31415_c0_g1_i1:28-1881(-)